MPHSIPHTAPPPEAFTTFTRLPDRAPGEQQHGYPFKPERLPEAPLKTPPEEQLDEPVRHAAEGDDDLMSQDVNASVPDAPS
ncbi:hypothetical protein HOP52_07575 [Halomonas campisalis]|uniref:Uncharacterized protein n=1 Tax=Billgrantia campisalis TaxID=74661 RepID=A0ABS9P762_9GAMM|nr:hypothetical protein [Halomonas campisalis]MCG6657620.1 hypothetical protein [Halomonas campisalis]MDR5862608.1 hypothetical protein [Halomonas campisalis]